MKKILLIGNPNVGKSVVFSRLTGIDVISSNYPGTTVEYTKGYLNIAGEKAEIIDVPGTYSLDPTSKAEEVAVEMLKEGDIIIDVLDATNLERNLNLALQLLKKKIPMIIVLNFWDETKHLGVNINAKELEFILKVPVVCTSAVIGEGIKNLVERLPEAKISDFNYKDKEIWLEIGRIIGIVEKLTHRHHTFLESLSDASIRPLTGIPITLGILFVSFQIIRLIGEGLIQYVFNPVFERLWLPVMNNLSQILGSTGFIHDMFIGKLIEGRIDFIQSFGIFTTGFYVPFAMVFPYVFAFYLVLGFFEDWGFLPRLSILLDRILHQLGLHGLSIIPMLLGFGCNVPGMLATRIMETKREKIICATLIAISIPCAAKSTMIIGLLGRYGIGGLAVVFGTLFLVFLTVGIIFNRMLPGESPEIFVEIPPYRIPYLGALAKKLWMRTKWFLKEAIPFVLLGVVIANILYSLKIIEFLGIIFSPVITKLFGLPAEAVAALVIGFLRKDVAVGMLAPLNLSLKQMIVATVVLSMYFPCIATFTVMIKEIGLKDTAKIAGIMISLTIFVGIVLNIVL